MRCLYFLLFHFLGLSFSAVLPHKSLLPLVNFASAVILLAVQNAASAHRPFFGLFCCCCCLYFLHQASHTQWHVFVNITKFESASSFSVPILVFLALFSLLFSRLMHAGKSPSTCLSFCLPPPSLVHLSFPWFPCVVVYMWLLEVFPSSLRLCPIS